MTRGKKKNVENMKRMLFGHCDLEYSNQIKYNPEKAPALFIN